MMLQIVMCVILLWPLFLSLDQYRKVLTGDFSTFMARTLIDRLKFPKFAVLIISLLLPIVIILLIIFIMSMKDILK
jgi:hypothetical protein